MPIISSHRITPDDGYRARVVFQLPASYEVPPGRLDLGESATAVVQKLDTYRVVTSGPFETSEAAEAHCARLAAAIAYAALQDGTSVRVNPDVREVRLLDEPHSLTPHGVTGPIGVGMGQFDEAAVIPPGLHVTFDHAHALQAVVTRPVDEFGRMVSQGLAMASTDKVWQHPKLRLALELFSDSYFERSRETQFLMRMTVLEALKTQTDRHAVIRARIDEWMGQLGDLPESERQSVATSLEWLKRQSIGRAIRELVTKIVDESSGRIAYDLYGLRSRFLHDGRGRDELRRNIVPLTNIVRDVLLFLVRSPEQLPRDDDEDDGRPNG